MAEETEGLGAAVLEAFRDEAGELVRRIEHVLLRLASAEVDARAPLWSELRRTLHTLKGSAAAAGQADVKELAHALEERLRGVEEEEQKEIDEIVGELSDDVERLHRLIAAQLSTDAPPEKARAGQPPASAASFVESGDDMLRVPAERVDALHTAVGDLVVTRLQQDQLADRILGLRDRLAETQRRFKQLAARDRESRLGRLARGHRRDDVRALSEMLGAAFQEAYEAARAAPLLQAQAAAVTTTLEDRVRELRLMPLAPFLEDYGRAVRQAARQCGKRVHMEVSADGAEIDRAVLVRLRDPLLHLVRNAVVHGIETPTRRAAAGKSEAGCVRLEAHCAGARARIRVQDDGAGIDMDRVVMRAREIGAWDPASGTPDGRQLLEILARPGFSTHEVADELAGRGVGLDVVASAVEALDGALELEAEPGAGTCFVVDVPITASTGMGLVVESEGRRFGVLMTHVERILRIAKDEVERIEERDAVRVEGDPLALLDMGMLLGLRSDFDWDEGKRPGLVLRLGSRGLVLLADEIHGEQAMVIKRLPGSFASASAFLGGAVQADYGILPVIQVSEIFERAADDGGRRMAPVGDTPRSAPGRPAVLVVEDSLTMRTLERNLLQAAGYEVAIAHDGASALEELDRMERCDLVVTDYQMPGMDGVELCRAVRRSERPQLPILMVTSVGDPEEKRQALEAGADAYLVKSDFEQAAFLDQVAELCGRTEEGA